MWLADCCAIDLQEMSKFWGVHLFRFWISSNALGKSPIFSVEIDRLKNFWILASER
jgi:hypothetical protein